MPELRFNCGERFPGGGVRGTAPSKLRAGGVFEPPAMFQERLQGEGEHALPSRTRNQTKGSTISAGTEPFGATIGGGAECVSGRWLAGELGAFAAD